MSDDIIFEMRGIEKRFGATRALRGVHLTVRSGEIHAVMGENGAGKSTLMKILSGVYTPDAGEIILDGKPIRIRNPGEARALGINLIYQELSVAKNMTVAQNVFMGSEPKGPFFTVKAAEMRERTNAILADLGSRFNADSMVSTLSIAEQQQVEIARALVHKSRILIMDEPTAALSDRETEQLFRIIEEQRDKGLAVLYISHRMAEVERLARRITVLRDGAYVGELGKDELDQKKVVQMMVGRPADDFYQHQRRQSHGAERLRVENVGAGKVRPASFVLHAGEVTGLAGLVGAGRTELARLIFGADKKQSGQVWLDGKEVQIGEPLAAIRHGIGYLPEDRKSLGLFMQLSAMENMSMNILSQHAKAGVVDRRALTDLTLASIASLNVKVSGPEGIVGGLSGGNQQKVLLARWLAIKPKVLILDEPTRGVDVGAKSEIYKIIHQLADAGTAVLCISSELAELVGICDRVMVMCEGKMTGEVTGDNITQEQILALATHHDAA
ncbi:sugar ABC transporter ATP-binding protein [Janthinobacterium aquaticum]|uniref:sugar ABC transporter ATP-binding protein n=1 Tax=Janthinobacterium sp. FT58W TaxID=2654254 RepID=UPI001265A6DD|nr:sugar ABC transporter ATP-binding protein [Janthinobacterium sp. FT58W]KAB8038164.1 ATP-binding cassette domain-containing protein [Janthinobacterium sp. FT58W]